MVMDEVRRSLKKARRDWARAAVLASVAGIGSAFFFTVSAFTAANLYRAVPIETPDNLFAAEWSSETTIQKVAPAGSLRYLDVGGIGNTKSGNTFPWPMWETVREEDARLGTATFAAWAPVGSFIR